MARAPQTSLTLLPWTPCWIKMGLLLRGGEDREGNKKEEGEGK